MSVTEHTPISTATGDGVSLAAGFAFPVLDEADLKVKVAGVLLTLNVDYTVAGVGNPAGGTVTFTAAPANGAAISLYRESVLQRETDYQTAGDFRAETVNPDFDRLWLVLMETLFGARSSSASMRAPLGEILAEMPARASRASKVSAFDSNGDPIAVAPGGDASGLETRLQSLLDPADGAGLVGFDTANAYEVGTVGAYLRRVIHADDFIPSSVTKATQDCSTYINAALLAAEARGGGDVLLGVGRYALSATVQIPDNCSLIGQGRAATELFLLAGSNVNLIQKKAGDDGTRAGLKNLALNGNDANNTAGGLYWQGPNVNRGPSLTVDGVLVNYCAPATGSGTNGAVVLEGGQWGVMRDVDITFCQKAIGLWHKGSDWLFDGVFFGPNGATLGAQSVVVQAGAGNRFVCCYFGGNGGLEQVLLSGAQRNAFISCENDNAWESAYRLIDFGGNASNNNEFLGGRISHAGGKTDNTFDAVSLEGAATGNVFNGVTWIGAGHTSSLNNARYAVAESGTAGGNIINGGTTDGLHQTGFKNLRAAGNSVVRNVKGFNPQGVTTITPGASPYTYTNQDHVPQMVYIRAGTVSDVSKNGTTLATATGAQVWLEPGESIVVTYSSAPTMLKDRK